MLPERLKSVRIWRSIDIGWRVLTLSSVCVSAEEEKGFTSSRSNSSSHFDSPPLVRPEKKSKGAIGNALVSMKKTLSTNKARWTGHHLSAYLDSLGHKHAFITVHIEGYICSTLTKPRALLLLLGSGGISLWILFRKKEEKQQSSQKRSDDNSNLPEEPNNFSLSPTSLLRKRQGTIAPCPNCQRGTCRLRKHQYMNQQAGVHYSNVSSNCNSPIFKRGTESRLPPTSSPDSADDENSDSEDFIYLQLNSNFNHPRRRRSGSWLSNNGSFIADRSEGEGMSDPSLNGSNMYYPSVKLFTATKRSPGDGRDHLCGATYGPSSLSSGDACDCSDATGSMVELIKGAREVRKLIREASFDSLTSDLSFQSESRVVPSISVNHCKQQENENDEGTEEDQVPHSLRINQSLNKNFYSMIALSSLDFDPTSSSGVNSLEWESPTQGWHDVRESKYKMSIPPESDQELEWDAEISETHPVHDDEFVSSSFCSGLELDMEAELFRAPSACSSRRSSFGSISVKSIGKRLPPSGRSSVERELSEPPANNLIDDIKFHLSPLYEVKEPLSSTKCSSISNTPLLNKPSINVSKKLVPSDSLYISLRGSPPDNIEIMNNNS
ncbi:unnamed protein product [Lepeophtheirus salmonis]|uniref:(salmon louse) hypothetical protein n=1 Tax=Lepeophtheirus salmonis TaxID=72036 RepID=A0A7R8D4R9_LEPSM|nr:unnamed protein product [Lepeophtheirus salmonis]CAF2974672.1 unnamed protein product [Lepeophtheirus salmonis]